jgi:hypothetical protein
LAIGSLTCFGYLPDAREPVKFSVSQKSAKDKKIGMRIGYQNNDPSHFKIIVKTELFSPHKFTNMHGYTIMMQLIPEKKQYLTPEKPDLRRV